MPFSYLTKLKKTFEFRRVPPTAQIPGTRMMALWFDRGVLDEEAEEEQRAVEAMEERSGIGDRAEATALEEIGEAED